ncbi:MAG: polysaccharide deacetylase family protein [Actinomycetes bacterium]
MGQDARRPNAGRVALTFDMEHPSRARHDPANPGRMLDALQAAGARATFFVQGRWARSEPDTARRVVDEGHLLGCHSHHHAPLVSLTDDGVRRDVEAASSALAQVTGVSPRPWFRCPFGAGHDDPRVLGLLDECGYRNVHWNVEPQDWLEDKTVDQLTASVLDDVVRKGDSAVVLLHSWPSVTAAALPTLIAELTARGYELVGVDSLQELPTRDEA